METKDTKQTLGFIAPTYDENDYRFGGIFTLPKVGLQEDGDWEAFLPAYERQFGTGWDSYGCTVFGTLNALETLMKRLYGGEYDKAERYNYNLINLIPPGADPKQVAQSIRKDGVIDQKELPFKDSLAEFASPRPMDKGQIEKGHKWLRTYTFNYQWLLENETDISKRQSVLKENLKYSPIGISVSAWYQNPSGFYESKEQNNHWCLLYRIDEQGRYCVFDSYDQSKKLLTADHDIRFAMRYNLSQTINEQHKNILIKFVEILKGFINLLKTAGDIGKSIFSKRID